MKFTRIGDVLRHRYVLPAALVISLAGNVYLFSTVIAWQKAWLAQFMTTSDIERIFRKSGADVSFESVLAIAKKEYGEKVQILPNNVAESAFGGPYEHIVLVGETKLYFRNALFFGSMANVPPDIEYWQFASEF